jgi:XRE family aerobic/anaerobic benzoate catabolism transcriptional regulator
VPNAGQGLHHRIGGRVRQRRGDLGYTVKGLAERSGLSPRFLSDVESGKANISVGRLEQLAEALEQPLVSLVGPTGGGARQAIDALLAQCTEAELARALGVLEVALGRRTPPIIALVGVRGAGKSTVGPPLAEALGLPFVELDHRIEARAGLPIPDIFTLHGEGFYRRLELECFAELVEAHEPCVVALPGGIVASEAALNLLRGSCTAVWLRAKAQDYWDRVFAQGDTRPMSGRADAKADLRELIRRRDPLYEPADLSIDTSGTAPAQVVERVLAALEASRRRP